MEALRTFYRNNSALLVLGTGFIGVHYGWFVLQQDERLVPKEEQLTEQPILTVSLINPISLNNTLSIVIFLPKLKFIGILSADKSKSVLCSQRTY